MMKLHDPVPGYANDLHESMGRSGCGPPRTWCRAKKGLFKAGKKLDKNIMIIIDYHIIDYHDYI